MLDDGFNLTTIELDEGEKIPDNLNDDIKIPDVRLSRPRNLVIYDNLKKKIHYIENIFSDSKIDCIYPSSPYRPCRALKTTCGLNNLKFLIKSPSGSKIFT